MFSVERFSAVDGKKLPPDELKLPAPVAACWMSHQAIAKTLLETSSQHCLVLEDDVNLTTEGIDYLNRIMSRNLAGIDLLQIGFCVHNGRLADRTGYRLQLYLVKSLHLAHLLKTKFVRNLLKRFYGTEFVMLDQISLLAGRDSFELGTHAYIFSRNFGVALTEFNSPAYLPADLALIELAKSGKFACYRLLTNVLSQSNSPSSISNASRNSLESEIALAGEANVD
jgi:GR25 family glycosyltransferase involved in LPS biosynthesis